MYLCTDSMPSFFELGFLRRHAIVRRTYRDLTVLPRVRVTRIAWLLLLTVLIQGKGSRVYLKEDQEIRGVDKLVHS